jgi:hypothetical protein
VEIYLHYLICLNGIMPNELSTGKTNLLPYKHSLHCKFFYAVPGLTTPILYPSTSTRHVSVSHRSPSGVYAVTPLPSYATYYNSLFTTYTKLFIFIILYYFKIASTASTFSRIYHSLISFHETKQFTSAVK